MSRVYGENVGVLRGELAALLRHHRIQQRIGGPGNVTVPVTTTEAQRAEIGDLIQRYRYGVLTWCHQAAGLGTQSLPSPSGPPAPDSVLRRYLREALDASEARLPTLDELTTASPFGMVEHWRHAARAAALGEHDLAGDPSVGAFDRAESMSVIRDAAEITRALVVLDRRYKGIPGWENLRIARRLEKAAEACAFLDAASPAVATRGWDPSRRLAAGPIRPGIAGVIQAEASLHIGLKDVPSALNLRRIADSQRQVSLLAASRLASGDTELVGKWERRGAAYGELIRRLRNVDGLLGNGGHAAAAGANAVSRLRALSAPTATDSDLSQLDRLFASVDRRVVDRVRDGAQARTYFARTRLPRIDADDGRPVHQPIEHFRVLLPSEERQLVAELGPPPADGRARFRWAAGLGLGDGPDPASMSL